MSKADPAVLMPLMTMFHVVISSGSFSAAGRKLRLSPSAVSRQINKLEAILETQLITRSTRELHITEAGKDVFTAAGDMINSAQALQNRIFSYTSSPQGTLKVTAPLAIGKTLLAGSAHRFLERFPDISLDFIFTDEILDIEKESIELSIRVTQNPPENLVARPLFSINYMLVCSCKSPEYTHIRHPDDLSAIKLAIPRDIYKSDRIQFHNNASSFSAKCIPKVISNSSEAILLAITQGVGIGILPNFIAMPMILQGRLQHILPAWNIISDRHTVFLLSHQSSLISPRAREYIDFIKNDVQLLAIT